MQAQTGFIQNRQGDHDHRQVSSATAIALEELAQREKVLNMVGLSGSNDTTGKNCQRYGFRSQPSAYMACKALGPVVAKASARQEGRLSDAGLQLRPLGVRQLHRRP